MSDDQWVVVPNWEKLQHYTDRDPPWIKFYTSVNSDDDWCRLSLSARGLLVTLWAEYARSRGQLNTSAIPAVCRQKVLRKTLVSLCDAGLLQLSASKPLALTRSREKNLETEKKKTGTPANNGPVPVQEEEPNRDPQALEKIKAMAERIGTTTW